MKTFALKNSFFSLITIFTIVGFLHLSFTTQAQLTGGVLNGISTQENNLILAIDDNNNESTGSFRIGFNTSGYNANGTPKTNWAEKFTLLENGFLGLGTTSPKQMLHVNGDYYGKGHIWLHAHAGDGVSGIAYMQARDNSGTSDIDFQFRTQSAGQVVEVLRMTNNGNVGIGTTSPSAKLDLNGQIKINGGSPGAGKFLMSDANGLATWANPTFLSQWTTTGSNIFYNAGNVGIGTTSPSAALTVAGNATNNGLLKVVSNSINPNDQWWIGFNHGGTSTDATDRARIGVNVHSTGAGRLFFTTGNGGTQAERMRIDENGNVGVGTSSPSNKLDIAAVTRTTEGTHATNLPFYVTGNLGWGSAGAEFRHSNGTQGIGLGYNTIYATGSITNQDLGLASRGTGNLFFSTNAATRMAIDGTGKVGIGTNTPQVQLDIRGNGSAIGLANNAVWDHLYLSHDGATALVRAGGAEDGIAFQVGTGAAGSYGGQTYTEGLRIKNTGQVGIGGVLANRFEKDCALTVNGHTYIGDFGAGYYSGLIRDSLYQDYYLWVERGVVSEDFAIADVGEWDDYVFADDYQLPSLQQLENFVKTNKHLPSIPSEAEVKAHGYSVHKLNRGILKTVEELSLHAINQEKKISEQQEKLDNQATQIAMLQAQIKQYEQLAAEVEKLKALLNTIKK